MPGVGGITAQYRLDDGEQLVGIGSVHEEDHFAATKLIPVELPNTS